jgi:hypothetical protein
LLLSRSTQRRGLQRGILPLPPITVGIGHRRDVLAGFKQALDAA